MKVLITIEVPEGAQVVVDGPPPKPAIDQAAADAGLIDDIPWPDAELSRTDALAAQEEAKKQWLCPDHGTPAKTVPAGVSKKTGKPYNAFQVCSTKGCEQRPGR